MRKLLKFDRKTSQTFSSGKIDTEAQITLWPAEGERM
jgi:hypothetical protein